MPFTGILGIADSRLGNIVLGVALGGTEYEQDIESILVLTSGTSQFASATSALVLVDAVSNHVPASAENILELVQVASLAIGRSASNTLALDHVVVVSGVISKSADSVLALTDEAVAGFKYGVGSNTLALTQDTYVGQPVVATASSTLAAVNSASAQNLSQALESVLELTDEALGDTTEIDRLVITELELVQVALPQIVYHLPISSFPELQLVQTVTYAGPVNASASSVLALVDQLNHHFFVANRSIEDVLGLTQAVGRVLDATASSLIELIQEAARRVTAENTLELTQTASALVLNDTSSVLDLTSAVTRQMVFSRSEISALDLVQGVAVWKAEPCLTKQYKPFVGAGPGGAPTTVVPTLTPGLVVFTHPFTGPTTTISLRRPDFGNSDGLDFTRIAQETRGGTLHVFADPNWPKQQILTLDFSNLSQAQRDDMLDLLYDSCGEEVGLLDWEGRQWRGVINNPDAEITQTGRCSFGIQLEFEGVPV